uniref:Serpentine receptor class gamma n=1 Tax=Parastrongyloides trichosuri TaxID=131310 RepID=A0A0N4ZYB6_PARTI
MVSILTVIFLCIDIPGILFYLLVLIFLLTRLLSKDDDFSPKFYSFLIVNAVVELSFIFVEYIIVRFPLFHFFTSTYLSIKQFPGFIYGLSCYFPCVIACGQLNLTINRLLMIKFPFAYKYIMSAWGILALIFLQFAIPFVQVVRTIGTPTVVRLADDNSTMIVELDDPDLVFNIIASAVGLLVVTSSSCCILGSYTLFLLFQMNKNSAEGASKSERSLLALVVLQTMTQLFLSIVGALQFFSGYAGNELIYTISMYMYPFAEDLLCLSCPIMLCCVSSLVRKKLIKFYFGDKAEQKFTAISKASTIKISLNRSRKQ